MFLVTVSMTILCLKIIGNLRKMKDFKFKVSLYPCCNDLTKQGISRLNFKIQINICFEFELVVTRENGSTYVAMYAGI